MLSAPYSWNLVSSFHYHVSHSYSCHHLCFPIQLSLSTSSCHACIVLIMTASIHGSMCHHNLTYIQKIKKRLLFLFIQLYNHLYPALLQTRFTEGRESEESEGREKMGSFFCESESWVSSVNEIPEDPEDESSREEIMSDSDFDESAKMGSMEEKKMKKNKKGQVLLEGYVETADEDDLMRTKSLTDEDLDELKGCLDLGFGFSYDEIPELCNTLPALELCYSMSQKYMDEHQKSPESTSASAGDSCSSVSSPIANWKISSPGDHPEDVKARLKFWAQAVACTVRLCS